MEIYMNIAILDAATLGDDMEFSCFEKLGTVSVFTKTAPEDITAHLQNSDCAILNKVKLSAEILEALPSLRLICITATGFDNVDVSYCASHGIAVCNVAGYSTQSVAQLTVAFVLSLANNLTIFDEYVKSGDYTKSGIHNRLTPVFHEVCGKTWGIVGFGNIGKQVARVAQSLGCRVIAFKRAHEEGAECVSLEELMERSDIISVHLPSSGETAGIISREMIGRMKKSAILINVARGAVIDEEAVTEALEEGNIAGFASDVYTTEPFPKAHPYSRLSEYRNVLLTPHMAWGTYEARVRLLEEVALNIESFVSGGTRSRVNLKAK